MRNSIIGKKYIPIDNSWVRNLSDEKQFANRTLTSDKRGEMNIVTIVTDPFLVKNLFLGKESMKTFVIVKDKNDYTYFCLYHDQAVITRTNTITKIMSTFHIKL